MDKTLEGLERAYYCHTHGYTGEFKMAIFIDAKRELTADEKWAIRKAGETIETTIRTENLRTDPREISGIAKEKEEILNLFRDHSIYVEEIENGYYKESLRPWFVVTTPKGRIKIGWRKRVININWSDTKIELEAEALFPEEDVTKFNKTIHAWGLEKAQEYLNVLLK